jgi:putative transposase
MRLIEFSILSNHLHFLVEADSSRSLARGMKGLSVRVARSLNRDSGRTGRVFVDHYHLHLLRGPTELAGFSMRAQSGQVR